MATADTPAQQHRHGLDPGGLSLAPFRGLRYSPDRISDLASVLCPPYDVIDPESRGRLESADPHNTIRLVLPRDGDDPAYRYRNAARTLHDWIGDEVLVPDPAPVLYLYEQHTPTTLSRGLIGALGLREPHEHIVLPHEDVMTGPVTDRLELMRATEANFEPILLAYDGDGDASDVVDHMATGAPLLSATTPDGTTHRLWSTADPDDLHRITADLRSRQALIADGHHRYAAYLRLQAQHRAAGSGPGPWDRGLALLVDTKRHPMQLGAIHRVLPDLPVAEALRRAASHCRVRQVHGTVETALSVLNGPTGPSAPGHPDGSGGRSDQPSRQAAYMLAGDGSFWLLEDLDPALIAQLVPTAQPAAWRELDVTILHSVLFDAVWAVSGDDVRYVHDAGAAVRMATRTGGCAVLLRPTASDTVRELAAKGVRMPRKSTSFGPKPHSGLVLRTFATE